MNTPIRVVLCVLMSTAGSHGQDIDLAKYKAVNAYVVRPGILALPRFLNSGKVCELVLQRQHYAGKVANVDSTMPHEVVMRVIDELLPPAERGTLIPKMGRESLSGYIGDAVTTTIEYERISITIFGRTAPKVVSGDVVAVIQWKERPCT